MRQPPRGKTDALVSRFTLLRYAVTGTYVGLATVGAFAHFYARRGVPLALLRQWTMCSQWEGGLLGYASACEAFDPTKGKPNPNPNPKPNPLTLKPSPSPLPQPQASWARARARSRRWS